MLAVGQVIRFDRQLWRVILVNESRARVQPLNGYERDAENISAGSCVEIVNDLERAQTELELAHAERELHKARKALEDQARLAEELKAAEAELAVLKAEAPVVSTVRGGKATWTLAPGDHLIGTNETKRAVVAFLQKHPGATTQEVQAAVGPTPGAVAACLDRFWKAGVVIKS
jgi:hypothetical protein